MAVSITVTGSSKSEIGAVVKCITDYFRFQIEADSGNHWAGQGLLKQRIIQVKVLCRSWGWGPLLGAIQEGKRFDPPRRTHRPDVDTLAQTVWNRLLHTDSDEAALRVLAKLIMTERGLSELERKQLLTLIPPTCGGGLEIKDISE